MYIMRSGLVVAFVFLTTCLILTHTAPPAHGKDGTKKFPSKVDPIPTTQSLDDATEATRTLTSTKPSTAQPASTEVAGEGSQPANDDETIAPSEPTDKPVSQEDNEKSAVNGKTEAVLYYQVTKRMRERNLTLSDIQEVLFQKDADQFMFTLADKLGYLVDNKYDDPHIPVIKSRKDDLMALLEKKQSKYSNPPSQESIVTTNPPASASNGDNSEIGIEIVKAIHSLTPEASDELVDFIFMPDSLPRAVGLEIGYSEGDEHMKYLKNMDEIVLRTIVQHTLASKTPSKNGPSFDKQGTEQQTSEEDGDEDGPTKGPTRGPKQGTRVLVEDGVPGLGQSDLDKAKPGKENDELHVHQPQEDDNQKEASLNGPGDNWKEILPLGDGTPTHPSSKAEGSKGVDDQRNESSQQNRKNESRTATQEDLHVHVTEGEEEGLGGKNVEKFKASQREPGPNAYNYEGSDRVNKLSFLVENEDFLFFLLSNQKELYEHLIAADPDEDDNIINKAMEEYWKWKDEQKDGGNAEVKEGGKTEGGRAVVKYHVLNFVCVNSCLSVSPYM